MQGFKLFPLVVTQNIALLGLIFSTLIASTPLLMMASHLLTTPHSLNLVNWILILSSIFHSMIWMMMMHLSLSQLLTSSMTLHHSLHVLKLISMHLICNFKQCSQIVHGFISLHLQWLTLINSLHTWMLGPWQTPQITCSTCGTSNHYVDLPQHCRLQMILLIILLVLVSSRSPLSKIQDIWLFRPSTHPLHQQQSYLLHLLLQIYISLGIPVLLILMVKTVI